MSDVVHGKSIRFSSLEALDAGGEGVQVRGGRY